MKKRENAQKLLIFFKKKRRGGVGSLDATQIFYPRVRWKFPLTKAKKCNFNEFKNKTENFFFHFSSRFFGWF